MKKEKISRERENATAAAIDNLNCGGPGHDVLPGTSLATIFVPAYVSLAVGPLIVLRFTRCHSPPSGCESSTS